MHRLFIPPDQIIADTAILRGNDHAHLTRVLRARPGEPLLLLDGTGRAFQAVLLTVGKTESTARIQAPVSTPPEPPVFVTVAQALGKGDKFEQVIQHGTEAGAGAFVPVRAARCVADLPADRLADRLARWRQIAKGAAEQSGRSRIPEVTAPMGFTPMLRAARDDAELVLLLHPDGDAPTLRHALQSLSSPPARLWIAIGPEGGWNPEEVSAAHMANCPSVTLGPRILRTETAALVALSQIMYQFE